MAPPLRERVPAWARGAGILALVTAGAMGGVALARARARTSPALAGPSPVASSMRRSRPPRVLHVPRVTTAPELDGRIEEALWRETAARTGPFVDDAGAAARPYSEARAAWSDEAGGTLYLALYAADIDLEARVTEADGPMQLDDAFRLTFATAATAGAETRDAFVLEGSVRGTMSDARTTAAGADPSWNSGARLAADTDGTLNDAKDDDEEWTLEWAIPLAAVGHRGAPGETIPLALRRCDTPKHGPRVCAGFGDGHDVVLVLDP
jgi:hypothetical protein